MGSRNDVIIEPALVGVTIFTTFCDLRFFSNQIPFQLNLDPSKSMPSTTMSIMASGTIAESPLEGYLPTTWHEIEAHQSRTAGIDTGLEHVAIIFVGQSKDLRPEKAHPCPYYWRPHLISTRSSTRIPTLMFWSVF